MNDTFKNVFVVYQNDKCLCFLDNGRPMLMVTSPSNLN